MTRSWLARLTQFEAAIGRLPDASRPLPWLALLCLLLFLPGMLTIQALDLGETRIAVATRHMLDSGDLLRIRVGGAEDHATAVGIHWLQAALVRGLEMLHLAHRGGIAAYRLASLVGATLAVMACFHWGQAVVGRRAAFLGAAMLAGCAALVMQAHLATAAAPLLAATATAMGLLGIAYLRPDGFTARRAAALWLSLAVCILLGGPVAVLLPLLTVAALAATDRRRRWLRALRAAWGLPLMLGLALPWFLAIAAATSGRALSELLLASRDAPPRLPGLHLLAFAATAFPAAWIALQALPGIWRDRAQHATRFLVAWGMSAWILAEAGAWRPEAILPALPPVMLLAARWASDPALQPPPRWLAVTGASLLLVVAAAFPVVAAIFATLDLREAPFALVAIAAACLLAWRLLAQAWTGRWERAALLSVILVVPLYAALLQGTFSNLLVGRIQDRIAGMARGVMPGITSDRFGILGYRGESLLFALGPDLQRFTDATEATGFLRGAPDRVVAVADVLEEEFRRAAAQQGLSMREAGQIVSFDPMGAEFVVFVFYTAAASPG